MNMKLQFCFAHYFLSLWNVIKCDVNKQNESELANTIFKIQPNKADSFFCFLLFVQPFSCLYLGNQLPNLCGVFTKLKLKQYPNRKYRKKKKNRNHIFQLQTRVGILARLRVIDPLFFLWTHKFQLKLTILHPLGRACIHSWVKISHGKSLTMSLFCPPNYQNIEFLLWI